MASVESDVERIIRDLIRDCERKGECEECGEDEISIGGKDSLAREYARKITAEITRKLARG